MSEPSMNELRTVIETWISQRTLTFQRQPFNEGANASSLREFVEIQNRLSRRLISILQTENPDFWSAFVELGMNASRIVEGGKILVDKQDRSQEGM